MSLAVAQRVRFRRRTAIALRLAPTRPIRSRAIQYVDMKTYLVDDILTKVDRASMANSLEVRCPLLDHKLMELIAPDSIRPEAPQRHGKYIFKKALERVLPPRRADEQEEGFCRARCGVVPRGAQGVRA